MNILTFETATAACSVALQCGNTIYTRHEIAPQQHAKLLLPMIQALILEAKINLTDLNVIGFGYGPGSFMGVRLATGMAQGLGFGLQIPLIPLSTLQIIAQTAYQQTKQEKILAGWDARMHEIYWGFFQCDQNGLMQSVIANQLTPPSKIDTQFLDQVKLLAGNAWQVYAEHLPTGFSTIPCLTDCFPNAKAMLPIVQTKYLAKEVIAAVDAEPHYIRQRVVNN